MTVSSVSTITATSTISWQNALEKGFKRASKTLRGIEAIEVVAERVRIEKGEIKDYEVDLKIIFALDD